jgi:hypothetical protein
MSSPNCSGPGVRKKTGGGPTRAATGFIDALDRMYDPPA